jgi:iron complex outermembrane receptor protein
MRGSRRALPLAAAALVLGSTGAAAQQPSAPVNLQQVEVIGTSPLPGSGIDRDKVPANVQSLKSSDLSREGSADLIGALTDRAGSVNVNASAGDPFQPDILFRGFEASPVLGTPQGLAVYQNGVRINEAFGDTVNWDLIPDLAIERIDVVSSNPVYGLNALGGAAIVSMKNGFSARGFEGEVDGGSFGQRGGAMEYGRQVGNYAGYVAARVFDEDGWRQFSPDHVRQLYADFARHGERLSLDLSFTGAGNRLFGKGSSPEQELAVNRALVFTSPQENVNQIDFVTLGGAYQASDVLSFQGNAYRREFHQTVANGNTTNYTACASGNGLLCQADGTTPLAAENGSPIPDLSNGGGVPIGENDRESIHAITFGGSLQLSQTGALFGRQNNFVLGASIDHSTVAFASSAEVGVINRALRILPSGYFVDTPENSGFAATPVGLGATNDYYGGFASDTFNLLPALAVTVGARYNVAEIGLADRIGSNLSGNSRYRRFNLAAGAAYKISGRTTAYAGYSEGNRAPTASEIECSDPARPCLLPSSLSADPPTLRQVVSRTWEAGLRGRFAGAESLPGAFTWNLGAFRSDLLHDIYGVATSISSGFFENIGTTRRQGVEAGLTYKARKWSLYGSYSLVDATFRTPLTLASPNNPHADADGNIQVQRGDRLPGIPEHQLKLGADYRLLRDWSVGGVLVYNSGQFLRGDEANRNPALPGYAVVNLHTLYTFTPRFEVFADLQNAFDTRYATFGQYGDPTGIGAPGIPANAVTNGPGVDNRFLSPAAPIAFSGGVRLRF